MSQKNVEFWKAREREGDSRVLTVLNAVSDEWETTKEITKRSKLPNNTVRNVLLFLAHTHRISTRMLHAGNFSSYQWRIEGVTERTV